MLFSSPTIFLNLTFLTNSSNCQSNLVPLTKTFNDSLEGVQEVFLVVVVAPLCSHVHLAWRKLSNHPCSMQKARNTTLCGSPRPSKYWLKGV